jgi:hypothetical protein
MPCHPNVHDNMNGTACQAGAPPLLAGHLQALQVLPGLLRIDLLLVLLSVNPTCRDYCMYQT